MVLPIIFLIVLSLIGLVRFHMESFKMQIDLQQEVLLKADLDTSLFKNIELSNSQLLSPGGVYNGVFERDYTCRWFKLEEGWAIRAGGLRNALTE